MKVLYVIPGPEDETTMFFIRRQINSVAEQGISTHNFFLKSRDSLWQIILEKKRLMREIKTFKPDIVHAQYGTMTSFFCMFCGCKKFIVTFRGSDINFINGMNFFRSLAGKVLSYISILKADAVVCVSENLKKHLWWGKKKAIVVPSGINNNLFHPIPKREAREQLGLLESAVLILFNAGGNRTVKRRDLAEKALKYVRSSIPNAELLILDGTINPSRIYLHYNAADCLLITSDNEGSPNVVKEALACNLPVVSVDVGDVRERLEGVFPSKIVPRDPKCIACAVHEVLFLGKRSNGRDKISEITDERVAKTLIKLYKRIVGFKKLI